MDPLPHPPTVVLRAGCTTLYHWTNGQSRADEILKNGFLETGYREPKGVHLCHRYDQHRRGCDDVLLLVELPLDVVTDDCLDEIRLPGCKDYVISASVIQAQGTVRLAYDEESR